jgi:hypothetical protein
MAMSALAKIPTGCFAIKNMRFIFSPLVH